MPLAVVGRVTGDGLLVLYDAADASRPVDLPLDDILGQLPPKKFDFERLARARAQLEPLVLPPAADFRRVLDLVLRLPAIGSKRFLTNKVDLDVTGLVIQRQLRRAAPPAPLRLRPHRPDLRRPFWDRAQPGRAADQGPHQPRAPARAWPSARRS